VIIINKDLKQLGYFNLVLYFAFIVLSNIFIGFVIGKVIEHFTNKSFFIVIFMLIGVISGLYSGIKELMKEAEKYERTSKKIERNDSENNNSGKR